MRWKWPAEHVLRQMEDTVEEDAGGWAEGGSAGDLLHCRLAFGNMCVVAFARTLALLCQRWMLWGSGDPCTIMLLFLPLI